MTVHGTAAEAIYFSGSFDAGGPCALGIPTVMYGTGDGSGLLSDDYVAIADVERETRVLARTIVNLLESQGA